jgi:hypothetical protein
MARCFLGGGGSDGLPNFGRVPIPMLPGIATGGLMLLVVLLPEVVWILVLLVPYP